MSADCDARPGATVELQLPPRDTTTNGPAHASVSPRARSPLRRSALDNTGQGGCEREKNHGSPRRMSIFATPSGARTSGPRTPRTPRTPKASRAVRPTENTEKSAVAFGVSAEHDPFLSSSSEPSSVPVSSSLSSSPSSLSPSSVSLSSTVPGPRPETGLQKQCAELYAKLASAVAENQHLEDELAHKSQLVDELSQKIMLSERRSRVAEDEWRKAAELQAQEVLYYKDTVDELQRQHSRLVARLESESALVESLRHEHEEKYVKLVRSYKALQSNFELERNSKALLIDQIEFLTKERDILLHATPSPVDLDQCPESSLEIDTSDHSLSHCMGQNSDELHSSDDSDGSVHGTHLLSSFGADFHASSPMKDYEELSPGFQFPQPPMAGVGKAQNGEMGQTVQKEKQGVIGQTRPGDRLQTTPSLGRPELVARSLSPPQCDENTKSLKRQSLPAHLKLNSSFDDEFVLSPLKLTPHANSSYFDADSAASTRPNSIIKKRYSGTKSNHSRYNSHDIVPIKVEFEQNQLRSSSAPDNELQLSSVAEGNPIEDSDLAFMKLNGYMPGKRDSMMTDSSKRSSFISDINISSGDITRQEITKLKFELQSLKLHNEKLLSYIGFEIQKQKKNIKKLSSKQNLRPKTPSHNFEYSDAKLIEKSKEMLIHKKRVLRSVSINPILSTKYGGRRHSGVFQPLVGLGMGNATEDEEDFVFKSHFINSLREDDCDDYGFLNHNCKYNSRVLSKKNQEYSEYNDQQTIKKHKSQTFRRPQPVLDYSSAEESFLSIDEEPELEDGDFHTLPQSANGAIVANFAGMTETDIDNGYLSNGGSNGEWESNSEKSSASDIDYDKLNRFNQMKYILLGKEHLKKNRHTEAIVDENLKYKFLTIAIGIVIIGIKFTTHPQHQLTGS